MRRTPPTDMAALRVVFWGTSAFAVPALRALAALPDVGVVSVVAQPDKPQGRHAEATASPVAEAARELGLPLLQPDKVKTKEFENTLRGLSPDVSVVAAYGRIIPEAVLSIPRLGTVNIHPSLLPRWRGPSPIQSAIAAGDAETGVSIMALDAEMDHGPLLAQTRVPLSGRERYSELEARLADIGAELLSRTLPGYAAGTITPQPQDDARATFCALLTRDSGRIDWTKSAIAIERMERAYDPWPGVWTVWTDGTHALRVKLFDAAVVQQAGAPGSLSVEDGRLIVGAGKDAVSFGALQVEGKKRMTVQELSRGMPSFVSGTFR